jgi:hypothetical protein
MPAVLATAGLPEAGESDAIGAYDTTDINSGFQAKMEFSYRYTGGTVETVTLIEKSSLALRATSKTVDCGLGKVRDINHTTYEKVYEVTLPYASGMQDVVFQCYEIEITTCS